MKEFNKQLEFLGDFLKNLLTVLSGVSSLIPWVKAILHIIRDILQSYHPETSSLNKGRCFAL
jgi:hypothetical protein